MFYLLHRKLIFCYCLISQLLFGQQTMLDRSTDGMLVSELKGNYSSVPASLVEVSKVSFQAEFFKPYFVKEVGELNSVLGIKLRKDIGLGGSANYLSFPGGSHFSYSAISSLKLFRNWNLGVQLGQEETRYFYSEQEGIKLQRLAVQIEYLLSNKIQVFAGIQLNSFKQQSYSLAFNSQLHKQFYTGIDFHFAKEFNIIGTILLELSPKQKLWYSFSYQNKVQSLGIQFEVKKLLLSCSLSNQALLGLSPKTSVLYETD